MQGNEATFETLAALTPRKASLRVSHQLATLGAHTYHLCYYLSLFNAKNRADDVKADWAGSWKIQEFDAESWSEVASKTKQEFDEAMKWYRSSTDFIDADDAEYAIANIAHAAYHLGAIRALMPLVLRA